MNIKKLFPLSFVIALALATSCQNQSNEPTPVAPSPSPVAEVTTPAGRFAYVNMDSLQSSYQLCIEASEKLESRMKTYQSALAQKQTQLQQAQQTIQKKLQDGTITSEEQYKAELEKYARQEQAVAQFCQQQEASLAEQQKSLLITLQDSLDNYLADYNKNKQYTLILNQAVLLHAHGADDVTDEVVAGLNKRYTKK